MSIVWVTVEKFAELTGFTKDAVQSNVGTNGIWPEGTVWIKLGGRILISIEGWNKWLETVAVSQKQRKTASKSGSHIKERYVGSASSASPLLPTLKS